jgi:hypothetical protein
MKKIRVFLSSLLMGALTAGCMGHLAYYSASYRGKVVDADTKQPLLGAVVLAVWYREAALFGGHGPAVDYHDSLEVLTSEQGEFTIPKRNHFTWIGKIQEPEFIVYYPGYAYYPSLQAWPQGKDITSAYEKEVFQFELSNLKRPEELIKYAEPSIETAKVPAEKMPNLVRLANAQRLKLGLRPNQLGR